MNIRANLSKGLAVWKQAARQSQMSATLILAGNQDLAMCGRERFCSAGGEAQVWTGSLADLGRFGFSPGEVLVVFADRETEELARQALGCSRSRGGVVIAVDEGPGATGRADYVAFRCRRLSFADDPRGWQRLFSTCAEVARDYAVPLGRTYPVLRKAVAQRLIERTAVENGLISLAVFAPGAGLSLITLNQVRMVLSLAVLFGEEIHWDRALEILAVVGANAGCRAATRRLVRLFPGIGGPVKAVTGYTSTLAVGWGALRYFEAGAPAAPSRLVPALARLQKP